VNLCCNFSGSIWPVHGARQHQLSHVGGLTRVFVCTNISAIVAGAPAACPYIIDWPTHWALHYRLNLHTAELYLQAVTVAVSSSMNDSAIKRGGHTPRARGMIQSSVSLIHIMYVWLTACVRQQFTLSTQRVYQLSHADRPARRALHRPSIRTLYRYTHVRSPCRYKLFFNSWILPNFKNAQWILFWNSVLQF